MLVWMIFPIWLIYGIIIGLFGYYIDPDRTRESLIGGILLGTVGAFQGMMFATILSVVPFSHSAISPLFLSFLGGLLLLSIGKVSKMFFHRYS